MKEPYFDNTFIYEDDLPQLDDDIFNWLSRFSVIDGVRIYPSRFVDEAIKKQEERIRKMNDVLLEEKELIIRAFLDMCDESLCPESHDAVENAIREMADVRCDLRLDALERIREWQAIQKGVIE